MIYSLGKGKGVRRPSERTVACGILTVKRSFLYEDVIRAAREEYFPSGNNESNDDCNYYLANDGHRLSERIDGKQWSLGEYLDRNGLYASKVKLYLVVQVRNVIP